MKVTDFNLLKKLMPMTRSDSDGEALMAIRKANRLLDAAGTNWENVFNRLVTLDVEAGPAHYEPAPDAPRADNAAKRRYLEGLLDQAAESARGDFLDFVESLRSQFEEKGFLSRAQVEALERSVARARRA